MKFDDAHDGRILLGANPRQGHWVNSTLIRSGRSIRNAGRLPLATPHTLLTIGLISALKSITRKQVDNIIKDKTQTKPRLIIGCEDADFIATLRSLIRVQKPAHPLRAGKNWMHELARLLARFKCDFVLVDDAADNSVKVLRHWAKSMLPDTSGMSGPTVFVPSLVGTSQ